MSKINDHFDDVGTGWRSILERLDESVAELVPDYEVSQVKEKFGGLRIYLNYPQGTDPDIQHQVEGLLNAAEVASLHACEECGNEGEAGGQYWIKTLCPEHRIADDEARKNRWK